VSMLIIDLAVGDEVKLTDRFAATLMRKVRKDRGFSWGARRGHVQAIRKDGNVLVVWEGRASYEELPRKALEKIK
jgi:hypothetical protein